MAGLARAKAWILAERNCNMPGVRLSGRPCSMHMPAAPMTSSRRSLSQAEALAFVEGQLQAFAAKLAGYSQVEMGSKCPLAKPGDAYSVDS